MVSAEAAYRSVEAMQSAFELIATLHLTAYMWPPQARVINGSRYDYVIAGGGTAGCVLASRLSEDPRNTVLLLEAGGRPSIETLNPGLVLFAVASDKDWNYNIKRNDYTFQCQPNSTGRLFLGKMLGGTSSLSIELYQRGVPQDYDTWAKIANDSHWAWDSVLPLFIKSERLEDEAIANSRYEQYHGYYGLFGVSRDPRNKDIYEFLAAYEEIGHDVVEDVTGNGTLGYGKPLLTISRGERSSSANAFLSPAKYRKNLHVRRNTLVTKVLFDSENRAIGVEAMTGNETFIFYAKKEVILSAGPVNSPQLLMLSGIGPKEHLVQKGIKPRIDLPVGKNLQDHNTVVLIFTLDDIPGLCFDAECLKETYNPHLYTAAVYTGKVSLDKDKRNVDYTTINYIVPYSLTLPFCSSYYRYRNGVCENLFEKSQGKRVLFVLVTLARPKSRGCVTLRNAEPTVSPIIDPGYFSDDEDMKTMICSIKDYIKILKSSYFRKYNATLVDVTCPRCRGQAGNEFWRCYALCVMKPMSQLGGTCALGSVVDGSLRVRGVRNLRVADSSVMPTLPADDTVAPALMIAENAAIMIQQDNARGHHDCE